MSEGTIKFRLAIDLSSLRDFQSQVASAIKQTSQKIQEEMKITTAKIQDDFREASNRVKKDMDNIFDTTRRVGQGLAAVGTAAIVGLGIATKESADFNAEMAKVGALANSSAQELKQLSNAAKSLGSEYGFDPEVVAGGMQELAASGMTTNQILSSMKGVLSATAASGEDMSLVAETMASTLNAFGLSASQASHVADVLAQSANVSAIGVQDMSYSLKYVGPIAKSMGISLEEVSSAIIEMGNAGVKGEQAGTSLRAALTRLADPPKEAATQLDKLGITIADKSGKMKPLGDIIGQLNDKMAKMTNVQKAAALSSIFGTESLSGMMVLVNGGKQKFDQYTKSLEQSNGTSDKVAKQMNDNLAGAMKKLSGAIKNAMISIGDALSPAIRAVADTVTSVINSFNQLSDSWKSAIAIGGALTAILSLVVGGVLMFIGSIPAMTAGFSTLVSFIGGISAPIVAVIAGISALVAAIVYFWNTNQSFHDSIITIWKSIQADIGTAVNSLVQIWNDVGPTLISVVTSIFNSVGDIIMGSLKVVAGIVQTILAVITGDWSGAWSGVKNITSGTLQVVMGIFGTFKNTAAGLIRVTVTSIIEAFKGLAKLGSMAIQWGKNIIDGLIQGVMSGAVRLVAAIADVCSRAINSGKSTLQTHSPSRVFNEMGLNISEGLINGVSAKSKDAVKAVEKMIREAIAAGKVAAMSSGKIHALAVEAVSEGKQSGIDSKAQKQQSKAESKQFDSWENELEKTKNADKYLLEDMSNQEEMKFWQEKLAISKQGSENYQKVYEKVFELKKNIARADLKEQEELDSIEAQKKIDSASIQIEIEKDRIATLKEMGKISDEEEIKALQELEDRKYKIQRQELLRQLQLNNLTKIQKAQLNKDLAKLDEEYVKEKKKTEDKLSQLRQKNETDLQNTIKGSLQQQIQDLLMFQTSFKKAFENFGKAILQEVVKQKAAELAAWIMGENTKKLLKTTNNTQELVQVQTNQAAIQGVRTAGYATDLAAATAHNAAVKASAGAMAISVVGITQAAFQATIAMLQAMVASIAAIPPVGPALAASMQAGIVAAQGVLIAAGTTATGTITSMMAVPSFDVGTWEVPQDMVAQVHKGEPIIPAPFASAAKKLLTGEMVPADLVGNMGAPNINLTLHASAIDSKGIKEVLQKESQTIVGIIRKEYRNFNPAFRSR